MLLPENEQRPGGETEALSMSLAGDATILPRPSDFLADLDALAEHLRGHFVVQVVVDDCGHRRTTVYRSAGAAEKAVLRARERGRTAHATLVQMLPVGVVVGLGGRR